MKKSIFTLILGFIVTSLSIHTSAKEYKSKNKHKITILSAKSYQEEIKSGLVLVDYWASWCGPCRKMEPILKEIAEETNVKVAKLNVDEYKAFVNMQNISNIPTMIIYKDSKEIKRLTGVYSKQELLDILKPYM